MYQNLWDAAKAILRGKFIAVATYILKKEGINDNLYFHNRTLEKEEKMKPKVNQEGNHKDISEIKNRKIIEKIRKTKS